MNEPTTAVQPYQPQPMPMVISPEMSITEIRDRKTKIHQLMKELMQPGHHYGVIPGTDKPALHKPGAEMLCMTFRLMPTFNVVQKDLQGGHREYRVDCDLTNMNGQIVAKGVGSCSTLESKYRYRLGSRKCPDCGSDAIRKSKDGSGGFFCWSKLGGCGATFQEGDKRIVEQNLGKVENPDIADQFNTVLKMAAKRAHVHAVLLATACSDMFVPDEDDEDEPEEPKSKGKPQQQKPKAEQTPKQKLMAEAFAMQAELLKQGRTKDGLAELLGLHGIVVTKWGDLSEPELETVKKAFADELALGQPVQPQTGGKS